MKHFETLSSLFRNSSMHLQKKPLKHYFSHSLFFVVTILMLIPSTFLQAGGGDDGGGGGKDGCERGEANCPMEMVLSGATLNDREPDEYYYFAVPASQNISVKITDHDTWESRHCEEWGWGCEKYSYTYYDLTLTLHPLDTGSGACLTSTVLGQMTGQNDFQFDYTAEGGKVFCVEASGDNDDKYDIKVEGAANLEIGINDASANEDTGTMEFTIALTKASPTDTIFNFSLGRDGDSATKNTNYNDPSPLNATIPTGQLTATVNVPLIDKGMTSSKFFTLSLDGTSNDIPISTLSHRAKGTIIGSNSEDADDSYKGPKICYESRPTRGFCFFGSCLFYKQTTNVRAMVDGLSDIHIQKALTRGIAFLDFFSGIGIEEESMSGQIDTDSAENRQFFGFDFVPNSYYLMSMFPKGYDYRVPLNDPNIINPTPACINTNTPPWYDIMDGFGVPLPQPPLARSECQVSGGSMNKDDTTSYYDQALFKFGFFTQYTHLVTYTKNGETVQEVLQPCQADTYGSLDPKPSIGGCGIFTKVLNSGTNINGDAGRTCNGGTCNTSVTGMDLALPTFMHSESRENIDLTYSSVVGEQHVADITIRSGGDEDTKNIVFEAPYSSSYGKRVMFIKSISDTTSSSNVNLIFSKGGDYWIDKMELDKSGKSLTIETAAVDGEEVRIFIKQDLTIKAGTLTIKNKNNTDKFHIYMYGNFQSNANTTIFSDGYIYANDGIILTGTTNLDNGALSTLGSLLTNGGSFNYPPVEDVPDFGIYALCPTFGGNYTTGQFDAWDIFRSTLSDSNISDKGISTKITGNDFKLTIASLNIDRNATEVKPGIDIEYILADIKYDIDSDSEIYTMLGNWQNYSADSNDRLTTPFYTDLDSVHRNMRVILKACADYNATTALYQYAALNNCAVDCSSNVQETTVSPCFRYFQSSDSFAIRPNAFDVNLTDQQRLTAAKDINLKFQALLAGSTQSASDYNESENGSFSIDLDLYESGLTCPHNRYLYSCLLLHHLLFWQ